MKIQSFSIICGTSSCNANCPYCISKMTGIKGIGLEKININNKNFKKSCRFAQINQVSTIIITGKGEPTLYPDNITEFLKELKEFNFPIIELQTNGILLIKKEFERYLHEWYELGLTTIAISIVHHENEKNKEIFSNNYPELSILIEKLHVFGFTIRLSCTLIKGYIDSIEKVDKLIEKSKVWGVEQLSLRELAIPKKSENQNIYNWTVNNFLTIEELNEIKSYISKIGNKILTLSHGSVLFDVDGQNICITNALTIRPEIEDLRQIIFFPDGHLRFDWQYKGAIIL